MNAEVPAQGTSTPVDWNAALSPAQIATEATKQVTQAYKPAFTDLNSQQTRAQAIYDKQTTDNKYYQSWLSGQTAALQQHATQASGQIADAMSQASQAQQAAYGTQGANLIAGANAREGNVSNNAQSNAFGSQLQENQATTRGLFGNAMVDALGHLKSNDDVVTAQLANTHNYLAANQAKEYAGLQSTLDKISTARIKLREGQTAAITKTEGALQAQEIKKAESNRAFGAAVAKIGVSQQNANTNAFNAATNAKYKGLNYTLALNKQQQDQMNKDRTYQLDLQKFGLTVAKDNYERTHGLGPYAARTSTLQRTIDNAQTKAFTEIDTMRGYINWLVTNKGMTRQQAYHAVQQGGTFTSGTVSSASQGTTPVGATTSQRSVQKTITIKPANDIQLLNAAYNADLGGLTQGDVSALHARGFQLGNRYVLAQGVR
jgi:hypothetical protein